MSLHEDVSQSLQSHFPERGREVKQIFGLRNKIVHQNYAATKQEADEILRLIEELGTLKNHD